ncbi:MAG: TonB-dependent receptor [Bacteroidetes bacterium]|nr:TonB-dependent receptor [Bacteroidota bacterium]
MKPIVLVLLFSMVVVFTNYAQSTLKGKVIDAESGDPLIGAHVKTENIDEGAITDIEGEFELTTAAARLEVSYIGYTTTTLANINSGEFLFIELIPSGVGLDNCYIIVKASPLEMKIPSPIFNIPAEHLKRDNDLTITPALNRVPGILMHSGALNTNRITIRGIGNRTPFGTSKIRAYLDEISLTNGIGETTIEDIDLSLVKKVKIWKGPASSVYGAGLGGMIHLQSNDEGNIQAPVISSALTMGSYGLVRNVNNINFPAKDGKYAIRLNHNLTKSDGYRANNEYRRQTFSVLGHSSGNDRQRTSVLTNFIKLKAQIPSSLSDEDYQNNPQKAAFSWASVQGFEDYEKLLMGISHRHILFQSGGKELINSSAIFTSYRNSYESRPFNILTENAQATGIRSRFEYTSPFEGGEWKLYAGAEYYREQYAWQILRTHDGTAGEPLNNNQEKRIYSNLFTQADFSSGNFFAVAGLNYNSTSYELTDLFTPDSIDISGQYQFDPVLSPRLSLGYSLRPNISVFASVSHGFSPPSLEETLTPEGQINPAIQPEKGWNFEIGNRGITNNLKYEISVYSMRIKDLLVARRTALDQYVGINAGKTTHNGMEVFLNYNLLTYPKGLDLFLTYTFSDYQFKEFMDGEEDYSGNELTGTAPHILNAGLDYYSQQLKGFYGHLNFRYVAAMPMRDDNTIYSESYKTINIKAGYQFKIQDKWMFDLYAGINNLLDEKYASMILINAGSFGGRAPRYYYPALPRNFYAGIRLEYSF